MATSTPGPTSDITPVLAALQAITVQIGNVIQQINTSFPPGASTSLPLSGGTMTGPIHMVAGSGITGIANAANDATAATAGVAVGGIYRNGSVLMVRVT